jgi:hypothetical protein
VKRSAAWLALTIPACLAAGWYATRAMREMQSMNSESVVATFAATAEQRIELPAAGTYWVIGIGDQDAMKAARSWSPTLAHEETGVPGTVDAGDPRRAEKRRDRGGLDLLYTMRVPAPGPYRLRLTSDDQPPQGLHLRVTRFSRAGASVAMRSMGAGVLFSVLLLVSAVVAFRTR